LAATLPGRAARPTLAPADLSQWDALRLAHASSAVSAPPTGPALANGAVSAATLSALYGYGPAPGDTGEDDTDWLHPPSDATASATPADDSTSDGVSRVGWETGSDLGGYPDSGPAQRLPDGGYVCRFFRQGYLVRSYARSPVVADGAWCTRYCSRGDRCKFPHVPADAPTRGPTSGAAHAANLYAMAALQQQQQQQQQQAYMAGLLHAQQQQQQQQHYMQQGMDRLMGPGMNGHGVAQASAATAAAAAAAATAAAAAAMLNGGMGPMPTLGSRSKAGGKTHRRNASSTDGACLCSLPCFFPRVA
jgi:hypothetical protein